MKRVRRRRIECRGAAAREARRKDRWSAVDAIEDGRIRSASNKYGFLFSFVSKDWAVSVK